LLAEMADDPDDLHVCWIENRDEALTIHDPRALELHLPHIRTEEDYATCLHEIGHVLGQGQGSESSAEREREAWRWARENALVWTPAMKADALDALGVPPAPESPRPAPQRPTTPKGRPRGS
jgi:hypothetical protein